MDMEQRDYDSRTALHVAAAEGEEDQGVLLSEPAENTLTHTHTHTHTHTDIHTGV